MTLKAPHSQVYKFVSLEFARRRILSFATQFAYFPAPLGVTVRVWVERPRDHKGRTFESSLVVKTVGERCVW